MADELERLLGLPLDEFVAARTEAAKRLRKEGRPEEAAELASLRKPTAAVWAVNQAARREPGDVRALVRAAEAVRKDPAGGERDFRAALRDVVRDAEEALREAGRPPSDDTVRRIGTTAHAAAATQPDVLVRGILLEELEPSGFEAMAGMAPPKPKPAAREQPPAKAAGASAAAQRKAKADAAAKRDRVTAARRALAKARAEARRLDREAAAAERAAKGARAEAERAEEAVRRAEERLDEARGA